MKPAARRGNSLILGDGGSHEDVRILLAWFYFGGQRHRELEREYFGLYHAVDERVPRLRRLPDSEPIGAVDLFTDEELKTSPVYNGGAAQGGTRPAMVRAFADGLGGVLPAAGTAVAPRRPA